MLRRNIQSNMSSNPQRDNVQFGELIDPSSSAGKFNMYTFIIDYFDNPMMTLLRETSDGNLIYCVKIKSQTARYKRYIFAIVPKFYNFNVQTDIKKKLSDLTWKILQTRTLEDDNKVLTHSYKISSKTPEKYTYVCPIFDNIVIDLLVGKTQMKSYSDQGTLGLALETYNCIVYA